ncbi:MAG TPA: maleylpyruvate isomerase family mycothiol-dependent enzyme [Nocardioidaceae bacterium]|nr:maleylpyruvate isomerase family mycothiol-dependent enzyme [Nocardioidaceae bacterium]
MDKEQGWRVIDAQRIAVADVLESLRPDEWAAPSLSAGWTVRDVAAHLSIAATTPTSEVLRAAMRALGNFDRMIHDTAVHRAARPTSQIIADLRGIVGSRRLAPATLWRDPLLDILVHGQDMVRPLGRELWLPPEAARVAADWAWQRRFPFFPARRLRGIRLVADDIAWERGTGADLRGPIGSLLLVSTGRTAGLAELTGPGLAITERRFA